MFEGGGFLQVSDAGVIDTAVYGRTVVWLKFGNSTAGCIVAQCRGLDFGRCESLQCQAGLTVPKYRPDISMFDLLPMLLVGAVAGAIIGWVAGHHAGSGNKAEAGHELDGHESASKGPVHDDTARLEEVARTIRELTLNVAADVTAHQSKMLDITNDLQDSGNSVEPEQIIATVAELVAANLEMQVKLNESQIRIREQAHQLKSTQQLANTDALTGLANRRALDQRLSEMLSSSSAQGSPAFALIDIDHFKSINDCYGHPVGDAVLIHVANLLETRMGGAAFCARYGGEEFAVVGLVEDANELAAHLDRTRQELSQQELIAENTERRVTFSAGVCSRLPNETVELWLSRCDQTLYTAKNCGRNCVFVARDKGPVRFHDESVAAETPLPIAAVELVPQSLRSQEQADTEGRSTMAARLSLVSQMRTMANNIDLEHVSLAAVAIRLPHLDLSQVQREMLLSRSRGLLRAVDKVGFDDQRTLLSFMVTSNTRKTVERANELLDEINLALKELCGDVNCLSATLGISLLDQDSTAEDVIRKATEQAAEPIAI